MWGLFSPWEIEQARLAMRSLNRALAKGSSAEEIALRIEELVATMPKIGAIIEEGLV
ncbi:hypothetical protein [Dermacoccus nishinomiyaensis]|uniref:hypothetical protein n=1 Tax=Dermacoccus nishinomiyaensis TaxID=1274 RepID=UPI00248E4392|nr:hypothetical protein [Dermacoccus nishinomiyaensis]